MSSRPVLPLALAFLVGAARLSPAEGVRRDTVSAERRGPVDRAELEAFLDGVMTAHLAKEHVAGAVVAVVKDGEVFFTKGYGLADVAKGTPVDPERTLFRIGSVGKLFTWTAVMQLVEAGKLDLDADINTYLDFKIPEKYGTPITLRHALTHTPGFEEDSRGLFARDTSGIMPLGEWLATHIPARVRKPGTYSAYSNYATALAGYVVERASGLSYADYVEQRIMGPLGMRHSTVRQPVPPLLAPDMSNGYQYAGGKFVTKPFEVAAAAVPAGAHSATGADMARFMLAHLNLGVLDSTRILSEATATLMQSRSFGHDPRLPGWALGFYEKSSHGLRIIGHGGDTQWFHSDLALIPSERLGVFVSYNTDRGGYLSFGPFLRAFLDHYYPAPPEAAAAPADAEAQAVRIAGEYESTRRSFSTFQKAFGLAGVTRITADSGGVLVIHSELGGTRYLPVGPLLYREEAGHDLLAFEQPESGRVTRGFQGSEPMMALERLAWYQSPGVHKFVLGVALGSFLLVVLSAVARGFRRRMGKPRPEDSLPGRLFVVAPALLNLVFVGAVLVIASDFWALFTGPATGFKVALALPVLAGLLTLVALVVAVRHWRGGQGTLAARVRYSASVALALLFLWSLNQWNLLGWRM